jgi:hypothetical protein
VFVSLFNFVIGTDDIFWQRDECLLHLTDIFITVVFFKVKRFYIKIHTKLMGGGANNNFVKLINSLF